jgi:SAM-dependent methyltransferase
MSPNENERRRWNDDYWTSVWPRREALTSPVTDLLLDHLQLRPGERVLDIGSGGGLTSLAAARLVAPDGEVVGADLSEPLVDLSRQRAEADGRGGATFVVADVQVDALPDPAFDVAMSQFGVMFFDEPATAFANVARHVRPDGRFGFACWQPVDVNAWHIGRVLAPFVPVPPPLAPGKSATGPFSLGDASRTSDLLAAAGWTTVGRTPYELSVTVDADAIVDDDQLPFLGVSDERLDDARDAVAAHLDRFVTTGGRYEIPLAVQVFTATRPAGRPADPGSR